MPLRKPPSRQRWSDVVRRHVHTTKGLVLYLGDDPTCLDMQAKETGGRVPGRTFEAIELGGLPHPTHAGSWFLGVLIASGDSLEAIVGWARALRPADLDRIRVYHRPEADLGRALQPWSDAGLPPVRTFSVESWPRFHRLFGLHHAVQVHADHAPSHPDI